jgi:hypothetical protein
MIAPTISNSAKAIAGVPQLHSKPAQAHVRPPDRIFFSARF